MQRKELMILIVAALILMFIMPYFVIIDASSDSSVIGLFGINWDINRSVLPNYISRVNLLAPLYLALALLSPGFYYLYSMTKDDQKQDDDEPNYLHQVFFSFVVIWSAILFLVPSAIWTVEGIPLKPIANYWLTIPNFVCLSFIIFIFVPSLIFHQKSGEKKDNKPRPIYRQPGFILAVVILLIPDFISFHTHSTRVWSSQTYLEFGTIGYTVSIQFIRIFNQVDTFVYLTIAPAPSFPAFILRWTFSALFAHEVLSFLKDKTTHKNAIILTIVSLLVLVFLSIIYSTDFLVGDYLRYPIPLPILQLVGFTFIQNHQDSKIRVKKDPELKIVKVPFTYMLYSKLKRQISKETEVK